MLNTTIGQFNVFLAFVWLGAILAVFYHLLCPRKKFKEIFDALYVTLGGILFILFMHIYNLGNFRLFLVFGLIIGIYVEKIFIAKTLAQVKNLLYNYINHKIQNFKKKRKQSTKENTNKEIKSKRRKIFFKKINKLQTK